MEPLEPEPEPALGGAAGTSDANGSAGDKELLGAIRTLFDAMDSDQDGLLSATEYSMFCLATEGVDCDKKRWKAHCKALGADPSGGLSLSLFSRLYTEKQFARHFGKLALDMPRVGLVPPPALQRESSSQQTGFVWQFESAEGWVSFGVEDQHRLEKALENGELNPLFGGRQFDLQCMTQTNVKTNKQRKLRRLPATASPHGRMPSARVDGETVEISVSTLRMHNGQFWLTGRLDLYPSKLVFTPDQSQRNTMSSPTVLKLHVIDQNNASPKSGGGWVFPHKIDFVMRQIGTKMQLEFGTDARQQQIRDEVLTYLLQCKWEIMGGGGDSAADGWEPLPAKTQLELEVAYRADQRLVSVSTAASSEGRTNLHTMMHTQMDLQGGEVQLHIRRTGPQVKASGPLPPKLRRHTMWNRTDEWLELRTSKILGTGRWYEPPLAKIAPGDYAEWSTVSASQEGNGCDILYCTTETRTKIVIRAADRMLGYIDGKDDKSLPSMRLPPRDSAMPHEWELSQDESGKYTIEQPKARARYAPIGPGVPVAVRLEPDIGLGCRHAGFGWMAATAVTSSFDEDEVAKAAFHLNYAQPVSLDERVNRQVIVVDDSDENWPKVVPDPSNYQVQGIVPACVLERPTMDQEWQVELTGKSGEPLRGAPEGIITTRPSEAAHTGRGEGSLFDLGFDNPQFGERSEWRRGHSEGCWECVVRGLQPGTPYRLRIRSVVRRRTPAPGDASPVARKEEPYEYGRWCDPIYFETKKLAAPLPIKSWHVLDDPTQRPPGVHIEHDTFEIAEEKSLWRRWYRVRSARAASRDGMDVFWWVHPTRPRRDGGMWQASVKLETSGGGVVEADSGKLPNASSRYAEKPRRNDRGMHGRVRVGAEEVVCIHCQPDASADERSDVVPYEYSFITVDGELPTPIDLQPVGRFVRIDTDDGPVSVTELKVLDTDGNEIQAVNASIGSTAADTVECSPASFAIDGNFGTFCETYDRGAQWLRVDLGASKQIGSIEILNRIGAMELRSRLLQARVSITEDHSGTDKRWEGRIEDDRLLYRFIFSSTALEPEPEAELRARVSSFFTRVSSPSQPQPQAAVQPQLRGALSGVDAGRAPRTGSDEARQPVAEPEEADADIIAVTQEYPDADFKRLQRFITKNKLTCSCARNAADCRHFPSAWVEIDQPILMPFSGSETQAAELQVYRQFSSQARPHWIKFRDADGNEVDAVMKSGDDLRQDQLVLGMLQLFNKIWREEGVSYITYGQDHVPVQHPVYQVCTVGCNHGFVEMLQDSVPVDAIQEGETRANNGWRNSKTIYPSAVATFIGAYVLNIRDRHKGNMVVTGGVRLANIDFGWLEEGPKIDTGKFPIPNGLRFLMTNGRLWDEFCDLCWDAICVLRQRRDELARHWRYLLVNREMDDRNLYEFGPERIFTRLQITRAQLDEALVGGGMDLIATIMKDVTHARHDGVGAVLKELSGHVMGVGRGAVGAVPPPLPGGQLSAYAEQNREMPIQVGTAAYVHVNGDGRRELFSQDVNEIIARAQEEILSAAATHTGSHGSQHAPSNAGGAVAIPMVTLANGKVLRFEIRFGDAAISGKMSKPPPTGIVQVNLDDQNTRIVERYADVAAATAAAQELYRGSRR